MTHATSAGWISPFLLGCATLAAIITVMCLKEASSPDFESTRLWSVSPESPPVPASVLDGVFPDDFIFGVSTSGQATHDPSMPLLPRSTNSCVAYWCSLPD